MTTRSLAGLLACSLPLACVAGDSNSLVCIDWKADGIDACNPPGEDDEGGDTDGPEQVPNVCALVGAATGRELDLGGYTIASEPWTGVPESTFSWEASFPPQWTASGSPGTNTPSVLTSVPNLDGGHTLTVSNTATRVGDLLWIQADGAAWAELTMEPDAWPATAVELSDGSTIWWAPSIDDGGAGLLSWNFGGPAPFTVRGRENALERVALAGPSAGATSPTIDGEEPGGGRAWMPVSANCRIVAGTDETGSPPDPGTGSGGGDPEPPVMPGEPCEELAEHYGLDLLWVSPGRWSNAGELGYHPSDPGHAWADPGDAKVARMSYRPPSASTWRWAWDFNTWQPNPNNGLARLWPPSPEDDSLALTVRSDLYALEYGQIPGHESYPTQTYDDLAAGTLVGWILVEGGGAEGQVTLRGPAADGGYSTETSWEWADVQAYGGGHLYHIGVPTSPVDARAYYWDFAWHPVLRGTAGHDVSNAALVGWEDDLGITFAHYSTGLFGSPFQDAAFKPAMGYCLLGGDESQPEPLDESGGG